MGVDDLLRGLVYHWSRDQSIFPTEDDRLDLPLMMLFQAYTGCRPAELVDGTKKVGNSNLFLSNTNSSNANSVDADLIADNTVITPQTNSLGINANKLPKRPHKALCYEDICLWIVKDPNGGRDILAMEVFLRHHKGENNKPKPYVLILNNSRVYLLIFI